MNDRSVWTRGLALLCLTGLTGVAGAASAAEPEADATLEARREGAEAPSLIMDDANIAELLELPGDGEGPNAPRLSLDVPLGHSTRAVADFVTDFVTSGVVLNEEPRPGHDRVHRVRGSYRRGALALSWRVSF